MSSIKVNTDARTAPVIEQERFTCAIGALQSVVAIPRAVPILHSGPGCGTMIHGFFDKTGYAGGNTSPCTNFSEKETVYGGIDKLRKLIENTYKILDTDLQVVVTGCTSGLVGDDVGSLVDEFRAEGKPIVWVDTPGFKSTNLVSHSALVNAIIDQYSDGFKKTPRSNKKLVNLFASIPCQDPFWQGNLREYKRLLEGIGFTVNVLFGSESDGVSEWQNISNANFNILVSPWYGEPIVQNLEKKYKQPYYHFGYIPIGSTETIKFLNGLIEFALANGAEIDKDKAFAFIEKQRAAYYDEIADLASFLLEFRYGLPNKAHILHESGYVLGLSKFLLHETGIVPHEVFITDGTPEKYQAQIAEELKRTSDKKTIPLYFTPDAGQAQAIIREIATPSDTQKHIAFNERTESKDDLKNKGRGLIIGSSWEKSLARDIKYQFVPAALPMVYRLVLTTNYVGFTGGLRVIEDVYNNALSYYK
ncbi:MAG: hydrogenase [Oscillospiraceae bacterium]|jgi:nitrogenase molybdenum-iron protein beta chain|nr:hydrogenase [Oscillospiraceae bacterium]